MFYSQTWHKLTVFNNFVVVRCSTVSSIRDGYFVCHPSDDLVQGASCHFGCYRGHRLTGHQSIKCIGTIDKDQGHWSGPKPICKSKRFLKFLTYKNTIPSK